MSTCPNGHRSETDDWCEVCGQRMSSTPARAPVHHAASSAAERCPNCGTTREDLAQFCEECRYNFVTHAGPVSVPQSPPSQSFSPTRTGVSAASPTRTGDSVTPPTWTATVHADRDYFTNTMAGGGPEGQGFHFPVHSPELHIPLTRILITIGRRHHSTGETPDIDLARAPEDPGVSHEHAILVQQSDSTWSLIDKGSTNGTTVNGAEDSIDPYVPVPLKDGDRVHVGLWTTITIHRD
ncbi:FHA domain-containing protein [Streptomyces sp. NBC_00827]|uniref:FHA domain-containing protein n=1 Tax=Streptomyces sp. NBC_00827 TaxID=2903677 RepID=UPI00386E446C|nr:FHA domain-containing protein [Streptomyces sp. NBC_00827]